MLFHRKPKLFQVFFSPFSDKFKSKNFQSNIAKLKQHQTNEKSCKSHTYLCRLRVAHLSAISRPSQLSTQEKNSSVVGKDMKYK